MAFEQDPDARLNYPINWTTFLDGDTIATSVWLPEDPAIVTVDDDTFTATATEVFVTFSGAVVVGAKYSIVNRITTANGRSNDHTIVIKVKEQ